MGLCEDGEVEQFSPDTRRSRSLRNAARRRNLFPQEGRPDEGSDEDVPIQLALSLRAEGAATKFCRSPLIFLKSLLFYLLADLFQERF